MSYDMSGPQGNPSGSLLPGGGQLMHGAGNAQ